MLAESPFQAQSILPKRQTIKGPGVSGNIPRPWKRVEDFFDSESDGEEGGVPISERDRKWCEAGDNFVQSEYEEEELPEYEYEEEAKGVGVSRGNEAVAVNRNGEEKIEMEKDSQHHHEDQRNMMGQKKQIINRSLKLEYSVNDVELGCKKFKEKYGRIRNMKDKFERRAFVRANKILSQEKKGFGEEERKEELRRLREEAKKTLWEKHERISEKKREKKQRKIQAQKASLH